MTGRAWPSREEWQAKAEYAVRTSCTMYERLNRIQPDVVWTTLAEDTELEELSVPVATALRPLLTAEIDRLQARFPDRPKKGRARSLWFVELADQACNDAGNLGALEEIRTEVQRARREGKPGAIAWNVGRIRHHYATITLPADLLTAHDRMEAIYNAADERRRAAAIDAQQAAIRKEIARRATDEAWQQELERRADIDSPRVFIVGAQASSTDGDRMT